MIPSAVFVPAVRIQINCDSPENFCEISGVCQRRRPHMLWGLRERPGSSWKGLGSVARVRCWQPPVTGRKDTAFLLRSLCSCWELNHHRLLLDSNKSVCYHASFHSLQQGSPTFLKLCATLVCGLMRWATSLIHTSEINVAQSTFNYFSIKNYDLSHLEDTDKADVIFRTGSRAVA